MAVLLPFSFTLLVLPVAQFYVGHDALDGLVNAALASTSACQEAVHQGGLVVHVVCVAESHVAEVCGEWWEDGVSQCSLVAFRRFGSEQSNESRQFLRHLRSHFKHLFHLAIFFCHPSALREQLFLVSHQLLAGLGVVLVEVVHQRLDVLVVPVLRHQLLQDGICLLFREQLRSATQENLHRGMPTAFVQEVALLQLLLLHHPLGNETNALVSFSGIVHFNSHFNFHFNFLFYFLFNFLFNFHFNSPLIPQQFFFAQLCRVQLVAEHQFFVEVEDVVAARDVDGSFPFVNGLVVGHSAKHFASHPSLSLLTIQAFWNVEEDVSASLADRDVRHVDAQLLLAPLQTLLVELFEVFTAVQVDDGFA